MSTEGRIVEVWADWEAVKRPLLMGRLTATPSRGQEIFSFEYDRTWLESAHARVLDPSLQLLPGAQYAPSDKTSFGVFLDSSPDRWGFRVASKRTSG